MRCAFEKRCIFVMLRSSRPVTRDLSKKFLQPFIFEGRVCGLFLLAATCLFVTTNSPTSKVKGFFVSIKMPTIHFETRKHPYWGFKQYRPFVRVNGRKHYILVGGENTDNGAYEKRGIDPDNLFRDMAIAHEDSETFNKLNP